MSENRRLRFRAWEPEAEKDLYDAFRKEAWYDIHGDEGVFNGPGYYRAARYAACHNAQAVQLALLDDVPAGMVQMDLERGKEENACFLAFCYMTPEYRHQGLGEQLIARAEGIARARKRSRLRLRCAPTNGVAQRFYERHGFRKIGMEQGSGVVLELLEKVLV